MDDDILSNLEKQTANFLRQQHLLSTLEHCPVSPPTPVRGMSTRPHHHTAKTSAAVHPPTPTHDATSSALEMENEFLQSQLELVRESQTETRVQLEAQVMKWKARARESEVLADERLAQMGSDHAKLEYELTHVYNEERRAHQTTVRESQQRLQRQHLKIQETCAALERITEQCQAREDEHTQALEVLKMEAKVGQQALEHFHETQNQTLRRKLEQDMKAQRSEHEHQLETLNRSYENQIETLSTKKLEGVERLHEDYGDKIQCLESKCEDLRREHEADQQRVRELYGYCFEDLKVNGTISEVCQDFIQQWTQCQEHEALSKTLDNAQYQAQSQAQTRMCDEDWRHQWQLREESWAKAWKSQEEAGYRQQQEWQSETQRRDEEIARERTQWKEQQEAITIEKEASARACENQKQQWTKRHVELIEQKQFCCEQLDRLNQGFLMPWLDSIQILHDDQPGELHVVGWRTRWQRIVRVIRLVSYWKKSTTTNNTAPVVVNLRPPSDKTAVIYPVLTWPRMSHVQRCWRDWKTHHVDSVVAQVSELQHRVQIQDQDKEDLMHRFDLDIQERQSQHLVQLSNTVLQVTNEWQDKVKEKTAHMLAQKQDLLQEIQTWKDRLEQEQHNVTTLQSQVREAQVESQSLKHKLETQTLAQTQVKLELDEWKASQLNAWQETLDEHDRSHQHHLAQILTESQVQYDAMTQTKKQQFQKRLAQAQVRAQKEHQHLRDGHTRDEAEWTAKSKSDAAKHKRLETQVRQLKVLTSRLKVEVNTTKGHHEEQLDRVTRDWTVKNQKLRKDLAERIRQCQCQLSQVTQHCEDQALVMHAQRENLSLIQRQMAKAIEKEHEYQSTILNYELQLSSLRNHVVTPELSKDDDVGDKEAEFDPEFVVEQPRVATPQIEPHSIISASSIGEILHHFELELNQANDEAGCLSMNSGIFHPKESVDQYMTTIEAKLNRLYAGTPLPTLPRTPEPKEE